MTIISKHKSKFIAGSITVVVHVLLIVSMSVHFDFEDSSKASDPDDDLLLQLEQMMTEDIQMTPPGKDPLTDKQDKSSESISKSHGSIKPPGSNETTQNAESELVQTPDTLIKKIEVVKTITVDTTRLVMPVQDSAIAEIMKKTEDVLKKDVAQKKNNMTAKERLAFYQSNYRVIRSFLKVYPYALKTRQVMDDLNKKLATMTDESEKKKMIKETEQMLFKQYEAAVRTMSVSQGKLLLKLISRETNKTGYDIIKQYKGAFSATFWYGVGRLFGTDIKTQYHKDKEDSLLENIVTRYKNKDL